MADWPEHDLESEKKNHVFIPIRYYVYWNNLIPITFITKSRVWKKELELVNLDCNVPMHALRIKICISFHFILLSHHDIKDVYED